MRIISQDKTVDIPYENSALIIEEVTKNTFYIHGFLNDRYFWLGTYKNMNDAKAVLWDIASNFKAKKEYCEMPQEDEDLEYAYREV